MLLKHEVSIIDCEFRRLPNVRVLAKQKARVCRPSNQIKPIAIAASIVAARAGTKVPRYECEFVPRVRRRKLTSKVQRSRARRLFCGEMGGRDA